jgi:dTDP-4-amino-4,6-dideoxygalactose transaminase
MPGPGSYWIGEDEKKELMDVVESGYLFRYGDVNDPVFKHKVYSLEQEFAELLGAKHSLALTSGSAALTVALLALGIKPGDEVIVPAYTYVATFSAIIFSGATPILAEIDESLNLDPNDIETRITPKTKAILPVHMLGNPADLDVIKKIAQKHNLYIVEDACQATGASYKGKRLGTIGDIGAFSLNVFKTITAGDGGLIATNNSDLYTKAFALHDQGHTPNRLGVEVGERVILGMNYRMNELTGAVALAQLRKLDDILATLREKKQKLKKMISDVKGVKYRKLNDESGECATLLTVIFDSAEKAKNVANKLNNRTVSESGWHVYSNMEHVQNYLKENGLPHVKGSYPKTDDILSRSMNISIGVVDAGLGAGFGINIKSTDDEIEQVASLFKKACMDN